MTAWEATGEGTPPCRAVSASGEPLIVDWQAHQRANMEEAMQDGVAVVAYDCSSLRLLKGCRLDGSYGFMAVSKKEQTVRFENADEVAANMPGFGVPLLTQLRGELGRDSTLDLAMILVGKRRTTIGEATREALVGGPACEGATHYVRGAFVGAFAMGTGTRGTASLGAGLFAASSSSAKLSSYRDGEPETCKRVAPGAPAAPETCDALLRLELVGLGAPGRPADPPAGAETCPAGLVLTGGKCTTPSGTEVRRCKASDVGDCTAQCDKGDADSCVNLAVLHLRGEGVARDPARGFAITEKACKAGSVHGCKNLGFLYANGTGVARDDRRAVALYEQACDGGSTDGCSMLGAMYGTGEGVRQDHGRALALYRRACDGGSVAGCQNLGALYDRGDGVAQDLARAVALYTQACSGGSAMACSNLGQKYHRGSGVPQDLARAVALYKKSCDGGNVSGCTNLGGMYESGLGVAADRAAAVRLYRQGCDSRDAWSCTQLERVGETR